MTTERALNEYFATNGILAPGCTRADWYAGHFIYLNVGSARIPFFPILRRNGPILIHDLHHMLTGAGTDWAGELELAGWELASGGCGWHPLYWLDRLITSVLALVTGPRSLLRGLRAGWGRRNLYGSDSDMLLATDVERLRERFAR